MISASENKDEAPPFDPRTILFQGSGLLAVNKPSGLPIHRGTAHEAGLAESIDEWVDRHPGVLEIRVGRPVMPLHRLDREASGVVLFGLARSMARKVQGAFRDGKVHKRYWVVVAGPVDEQGKLKGKVRSRLRGKYRLLPSELEYVRLAGDERLSLVEVTPREGRTHQIRALFAQHGRPVAGDLRYGRPKPARQFLEKFDVPALLLHATSLELQVPLPGVPQTLHAPPPEPFLGVLEKKGWPLPALV